MVYHKIHKLNEKGKNCGGSLLFQEAIDPTYYIAQCSKCKERVIERHHYTDGHKGNETTDIQGRDLVDRRDQDPCRM